MYSELLSPSVIGGVSCFFSSLWASSVVFHRLGRLWWQGSGDLRDKKRMGLPEVMAKGNAVRCQDEREHFDMGPRRGLQNKRTCANQSPNTGTWVRKGARMDTFFLPSFCQTSCPTVIGLTIDIWQKRISRKEVCENCRYSTQGFILGIYWSKRKNREKGKSPLTSEQRNFLATECGQSCTPLTLSSVLCSCSKVVV